MKHRRLGMEGRSVAALRLGGAFGCFRRVALLVASGFLAAAVALPAEQTQKSTEFFGVLEKELVPGAQVMVSKPMQPMSQEESKRLPVPLQTGDRAYLGRLGSRYWKSELEIAFVGVASGPSLIYADLNFNGSFEATERYVLTPVQGRSPDQWEGQAMIYADLTRGPYRRYPIQVLIHKGFGQTEPKLPAPATTSFVCAQGAVQIGERRVVRYEFDPTTETVHPETGYLGMDCDGDGSITCCANTVESRFLSDEIALFRVGDYVVSTKSVDLQSGKITLRSHAVSDYQLIDLAVGKMLPDFQFTDLEGHQRNFAEFRGRHVLLDFWATWCGPCAAELPYLKAAYERFRSRGFEILGMNSDDDAGLARKFVSERNVPWAHATKQTTDTRFRIGAYPTTVLVDPSGKIISYRATNCAARVSRKRSTGCSQTRRRAARD